jgi:hypothetical protein
MLPWYMHPFALQFISAVTSSSTTYRIQRTWESQLDAGNNSVSQTQTITVTSNTPPYAGVLNTPGCDNVCVTSGAFGESWRAEHHSTSSYTCVTTRRRLNMTCTLPIEKRLSCCSYSEPFSLVCTDFTETMPLPCAVVICMHADEILTCTCQGSSGLVGSVPAVARGVTITIADVFDGTFGWGNASRSDCLAQFYQAQLLLTGCVQQVWSKAELDGYY